MCNYCILYTIFYHPPTKPPPDLQWRSPPLRESIEWGIKQQDSEHQHLTLNCCIENIYCSYKSTPRLVSPPMMRKVVTPIPHKEGDGRWNCLLCVIWVNNVVIIFSLEMSLSTTMAVVVLLLVIQNPRSTPYCRQDNGGVLYFESNGGMCKCSNLTCPVHIPQRFTIKCHSCCYAISKSK